MTPFQELCEEANNILTQRARAIGGIWLDEYETLTTKLANFAIDCGGVQSPSTLFYALVAAFDSLHRDYLPPVDTPGATVEEIRDRMLEHMEHIQNAMSY